MDPNDLTEEQKEQARECKTAEELSDMAEAQNTPLSLDSLDAAAGGRSSCSRYAERCRGYDKNFQLACKTFSQRWWD